MTSDAPRRVSVKDLAREIEARGLLESPELSKSHAVPCASEDRQGNVPSSLAATRTQRTDTALPNLPRESEQSVSVVNVECSRRCSDGDVFLRCKPRATVAIEQRRRQASLQDEHLPLHRFQFRAEEISKGVSNSPSKGLDECSGRTESQVSDSVKSGLSKSVSFKSGSPTWAEGTPPPSPYLPRDVGRTIFSNRCCNSAPFARDERNALPKNTSDNPLEEILTSLQRICEEFDATGPSSDSPVDERYAQNDDTPRQNSTVARSSLLLSSSSVVNGKETVERSTRHAVAEHYPVEKISDVSSVKYGNELKFGYGYKCAGQQYTPRQRAYSATDVSHNDSELFRANVCVAESKLPAALPNGRECRRNSLRKTSAIDEEFLKLAKCRSQSAQHLLVNIAPLAHGSIQVTNTDDSLNRPINSHAFTKTTSQKYDSHYDLIPKSPLPYVNRIELTPKDTSKEKQLDSLETAYSNLGIDEARSILANFDFTKYRRKKSNETRLMSSDSKEVMANTVLKARPSKSSNVKLKDLLDLLKPNDESSQRLRSNYSICRSSSFSNAEEVDSPSAFNFELTAIETDIDSRTHLNAKDSCELSQTSTLPKRKKPLHRPAKSNSKPLVPLATSVDNTAVSKSEVDEGLVSDSETSSGQFVRAYVSYATSPLSPRRSVPRRGGGHVRSASEDVTSSSGLLDLSSCDMAPKPGSSLELFAGHITPDKRKRRKGVGSMIGGPSAGHPCGQEPAKSGTGRSLTYPPQRKTTVPDESKAYTSVDSNGLKSFRLPNLLDPNLDDPRLLSDLSLADSHLCPSEGLADETYQDIVDSVMRSPDDQHLSVEDRNLSGNGKLPKKKHHSDPGGDVSSSVTCENVVFMPDIMMGSSRSEPDLGTNEAVMTPSSSSSSTSSQHPSSSNSQQQKNDVDMSLRLEAERHGAGEPPLRIPHGPRHARVGSTGSSRFHFDGESDRHRLGAEFAPSKSPQEQRRYSKRRLRGPYGEMLEEEMRKSGEKQKPNFSDLSFLQEISEFSKKQSKRSSGSDTAPVTFSRPTIFSSSQSLDDGTSIKCEEVASATPKRKISANYPLLESGVESPTIESNSIKKSPSSCSQDSTCSGNAKENHTFRASQNGLTEMPKGGEKLSDTRTHVVGELYDTEKSYVESLQILANKYMKPLKSCDYSGIVDTSLVDEIFFQIPEILNHHEVFLEELRLRLSTWDGKQKVGDVFVEAFTKQHVIDTYTTFINNWKSAKDAIKIATQAKPAFARFLEHMTREHKGKLTLDALLIMPVQRIPRYELLIKELLKHTHVDHPDHRLLVAAQREVHELAVKINRMEREAYQHEQMQQKVKDIEQLIDGVVELVQPDRGFIRHDMVHMPGGLGTKKERCLFLFTDLLIITSIKRRSGTIRKPSATSSGSPSTYNSLEMNKYKLLTKFSLDNLDITRSADNNFRRLLKDIENLEEDVALLNQINELSVNLNSPHQNLDEAVKEMMTSISKQLAEKQNTDSQLVSLEMNVTIQEGIEALTILFSSPEKRATWEAAFNEAKQKLALSTDRRPPPEFMHPLPIRKTRAGLQFTCAAATLGLNQQGLRDVWVCNSDGYVGQVCVLSLQPEPTVMSCNGVCNSRILAIASISAAAATAHPEKTRWRPTMPDNLTGVSIEVEECDEEYEDQRTNNGNIQLDSDSSEDDDESESPDDEKLKEDGGRKTRGGSIPRDDGYDDMDHRQPTMWLGTEDGCIHVYNCNDNIRTKKNKIKIQHMAAIHCIIYLDNRVFVALANGEVHIYKKDPSGGWCCSEPQKVQVGSVTSPVTKMLAVAGKLWCGCQNSIKVVNTSSLQTEHSFNVSSDSSRSVLCMVTSGLGVWVALQHSAVLRLFHATSYECLLDVNVAPAVTKMLAGCDDIIRQHKAACLRVTAILACKDLLWVGTSAGVVLTLPLPHLTSTTTRLDSTPNVAGLPHGHTGHVRFLTCVEMGPSIVSADGKVARALRNKEAGTASRRASTATAAGYKLLVISGGDGYEDFRNCGLGEAAGRDDSTNHLLLWQV